MQGAMISASVCEKNRRARASSAFEFGRRECRSTCHDVGVPFGDGNWMNYPVNAGQVAMGSGGFIGAQCLL